MQKETPSAQTTAVFENWARECYSCSASLIPRQARDAWNAGMTNAAEMLEVEAAKALARDPSEKTGHVLIANAKAIRSESNG